MDIIKSYLRTTEEFADAYELLKEKYQENVAWYVDALDLVTTGEPIILENGKRLSVELNDVVELVACDGGKMMIAEIEEWE